MADTYHGHCFCGAVEIEVTGQPAGIGYCHCESCHHWSAGPVNAFTLWDPEKVRVVKGEEHPQQYNKTENLLCYSWTTEGGISLFHVDNSSYEFSG